MKALVFHKPKDVSVDTVEDPRIKEPSDAIIKFTTTAICGSETAASIGSAVQRV